MHQIQALVTLAICLVLPGSSIAEDSCSGRCGVNMDRGFDCQCNIQCSSFGDCCPDYTQLCQSSPVGINSCESRCNASYDPNLPCQCNDKCSQYNNCCTDFKALCESCSGRCNTTYDPVQLCQCNSVCADYSNCCTDYKSQCLSTQTKEITDAEISELGQVLWDSDVNRLNTEDCVVKTQQLLLHRPRDQSRSRFFRYVNEAELVDTFPLFERLLDNYKTETGNVEPALTTEEMIETQDFLDAVLDSSVMAQLYDFFLSKGKVSDMTEFGNLLYSLWFEFYPRSSSTGAAVDSSGFEHVFVGEKKSSSVTGFHNWLQMYRLEQNQQINYWGYNYKAEPRLMDIRFSWDGLQKERASMFIGTSPEFDMAVYTVCMVAKPGRVCSLQMEGEQVYIQTYDVSHKTGLQVASAFPMVNGP